MLLIGIVRNLLLIVPLLVLLAGSIVATYSRPVYANADKPISSSLNLVINLAATSPQLEFGLILKNNFERDIVKNYDFPNLWNLKSISLASSNLPEGTQVIVSAQKLTFDFNSSPILPGETASLKAVFLGDILQAKSSTNYINIKGYQPTYSNLIEYSLANYSVSYPSSWGRPSYVNIKDAFLEYRLGDQNNTLNFSQFLPLDIFWGDKASLNLKLDTAGATEETLFGVARELTGQSLKPVSELSSIYKDDSQNVFVTGAVDVIHEFRINIDTSISAGSSNHIAGSAQLSDLGSMKLPQSGKLLGLIKQQEASHADLQTEEIVGKAISLIYQNYQIRALDWNEFGVRDTGIGSSDSLSYAEYTVVLNEILTAWGVKNNIVLMDYSFLGKTQTFLVEVCEEQCRYYSLSRDFPLEQKRERSSFGLQSFAYSGINQLVFAQIRQHQGYQRTIVWDEDFLSIAPNDHATNADLAIELFLPQQIRAFSNFPASISIVNNSSEVIYLQQLELDGNTFPIADKTFAGLHEGVLPGEQKVIAVENLYLSKIFLGGERDFDLAARLDYQSASTQNRFDTISPALVQQNYWFWGLAIIAALAVLASIFLVVVFYRQNKFAFMTIYWKSRRAVDDVIWNIGQLLGRLHLTEIWKSIRIKK